MSVPTAELTASEHERPRPGGGAAALVRNLHGPRLYGVLAAAALTIAVLSLLIPSTPSYDPWAWLVWGREIIHFKLKTNGGPTWKPLPVIFTTIFSLFGKAEPDLWLVVARAGAVMAAAMVFKVCSRLTWWMGARPADDANQTGRLIVFVPALLAGTIATVGLVFSGGFISDNALGYSEGLMTALVLLAVDRAFDGHHRQAFVFGFVAALDRPEIWLFWGPYGLYLFWKDPGARKLVISLFVLIPVLWFLPEYWGSGHFFRGVNRAQQPRSNSPAFAKCPFCTELADHAWPTILLRIKILAALGVAAAAVIVWRTQRARSRWHLADSRERAQVAIITAGVLGVAWFVVIAVLTQAGFSGNNRYLVLGSALTEIAGGAAWGWLALELGRGGATLLARRGKQINTSRVASVGVLITGLLFLWLPNWVGNNLIDIQRTHRSLVYQAHLREDITKLVREYGGAKKLLACGTVMTEGFQVPLVAWTLGTHTAQIQASPKAGTIPPAAPQVILQTRAQRHATLLPIVRQFKPVSYVYALDVRTFRLFTHCRK